MTSFGLYASIYHQLNQLFPFKDGRLEILSRIMSEVDAAQVQSLNCLQQWKDFVGIIQIDPLNSRQYCTFLIILSRALYLKGWLEESDIISYLNKSINCCEVYGHITLKPNFLIGHTIGIVLGKASYGNHISIQHSVTVGRWGDSCPVIGDRVAILNGSVVAGSTVIGSDSLIAARTRLINAIVPPGVIVFNGQGKELIFKENKSLPLIQWMANTG